jgi:hypothetical protein
VDMVPNLTFKSNIKATNNTARVPIHSKLAILKHLVEVFPLEGFVDAIDTVSGHNCKNMTSQPIITLRKKSFMIRLNHWPAVQEF